MKMYDVRIAVVSLGVVLTGARAVRNCWFPRVHARLILCDSFLFGPKKHLFSFG